MQKQFRTLGQTKIRITYPWGLMYASGSRVLCSDGKVRSLAYLAATPDTFFSTPGAIRIKGAYITGYVDVEDACSADYKTERRVFAFRCHTAVNEKHGSPLPEWPESFSPEKFALLACGEETTCA